MKLVETSTQWGNGYCRRYFLNGNRISESHANLVLKERYWEDFPVKRGDDGVWRKEWNLGPKVDHVSLTDHEDVI